MNGHMTNIIIVGAGPAVLTAAYELLKKSSEYQVTVLEESSAIGGISRTVVHHGNRMDMGGHRFFSKSSEVNEWWSTMLPVQGVASYDDMRLHRTAFIKPDGPNPNKTDRVMLKRRRLSRIYFNHKFFDYPISLKLETLKNLGLLTTLEVGFSYLGSVLHKREEKSLEDFYINRFGRKLYSMFFERYTENLWGRHPSAIDPSWGAQRVKGLSVSSILKDMFERAVGKKNRKVETSLIEEFSYPKYGPGQLWEFTAEEVKKLGGKILMESKVIRVDIQDGRAVSVTYEHNDENITIPADIVISSMPLKDLVAGMNDVPDNIKEIADGLPYRDYMTAGVLVSKLKLKNQTKIPTLGNIIPDNWVYVHDRSVKMGRFQVYNNWSPYMVKDPEHTVWVGLEYFCSEGDSLWSMKDKEFAKLAVREMHKIGMIDSVHDVLDYHVERVKKAYPAYFDSYAQINELREYLDRIENLYCIGRNGQHRYNNMDHSMCTAFEAVRNIVSGRKDKSNIWNVNTEMEYQEEK